jgi:hypothetical protein
MADLCLHSKTIRFHSNQSITISGERYRELLYTLCPGCISELQESAGVRMIRRTQSATNSSEVRGYTYCPSLHILHDFLLSRQRRLLTSIRIPITFGHEQGNKVNTRPNFLSLQLPKIERAKFSYLLLFLFSNPEGHRTNCGPNVPQRCHDKPRTGMRTDPVMPRFVASGTVWSSPGDSQANKQPTRPGVIQKKNLFAHLFSRFAIPSR